MRKAIQSIGNWMGFSLISRRCGAQATNEHIGLPTFSNYDPEPEIDIPSLFVHFTSLSATRISLLGLNRWVGSHVAIFPSLAERLLYKRHLLQPCIKKWSISRPKGFPFRVSQIDRQLKIHSPCVTPSCSSQPP